MKKISAIVLLGLVTVSLTGCSTNQDTGTLVGGVAGGLLGSQFGGGGGRIAATIIGAGAGAFIGNQIGKSMDETDRLKAQQALNDSKTGQSTAWKNPDTGDSYTITPTKTYQKNDSYCREFTQTATVADKPQQVYGTACRQPDGTWKIVDEKNQS